MTGPEFCSDFKKIVIEEIPLIDVRAPKEYENGAFPNAVNIPLMNDEERHRVGICYKEKGREAAVELGHKLVSGEVKKKRIEAWSEFVEKNPAAVIYCARGGMRSEITQKWIYEAAGELIPRLKGGYKSFRNYMIKQLEPEKQTVEVITLGGHTGSGKTILLNKLKNSIDLEGLAHHRGSGFGGYINRQPPPVNFENKLATALIKHRAKGYRYLPIEDESRHIGRLYIPKTIFEYFLASPLVLLEVQKEKRVEIIFDEYVIQSQKNYREQFSEEGLEKWYKAMKISFDKIQKRLGGENHKKLTGILEKAFQQQRESGDFDLHKRWIEGLLENYYDPMYEYQLEKSAREIIFRGTSSEVLDFFRDKC